MGILWPDCVRGGEAGGAAAQGRVAAVQLDLGDLGSVAAAARRLHSAAPRIDYLILNAGVRRRGPPRWCCVPVPPAGQPASVPAMQRHVCFRDVCWTGALTAAVAREQVAMTPKTYTSDGFETQIGTNHFGHFALTIDLLPHLKQQVPPPSPCRHPRPRVCRLYTYLSLFHWCFWKQPSLKIVEMYSGYKLIRFVAPCRLGSTRQSPK